MRRLTLDEAIKHLERIRKSFGGDIECQILGGRGAEPLHWCLFHSPAGEGRKVDMLIFMTVEDLAALSYTAQELAAFT